MLSVAMFPVVKPGKVTAFPVTSWSEEKPSLFTEVLWHQEAALIKESVSGVFYSSICFLMVQLAKAWLRLLILLLLGE